MTAELEVEVQESTISNEVTQTEITQVRSSPQLEDIKINIDAPCGKAEDETDVSDGAVMEFSRETDAPEVTVRVYDFDMVKDKTLRRNNSSYNVLQTCSSLPRYAVAVGVFTIFMVVAIMLIVWYFVDL